MTAIGGSSMICIMIINILAHSYLYLDLLDMSNVCLLVGFFDEQAQILHTWKIQVYSILVTTCKDTLPETNIAVAPENRWLEIEFPFRMGKFSCGEPLVSGRVFRFEPHSSPP